MRRPSRHSPSAGRCATFLPVLPSAWTVPLDPLLIAGLVAAGGGRGGVGARRAAPSRAGAGAAPPRRWRCCCCGVVGLAAADPGVALPADRAPAADHPGHGRRPAAAAARPARRAAGAGCRGWLVRAGAAAGPPVCGILAINLAFFGWHLTGAYEASLGNAELYAAQQLSLLAASVLFWWPIVVPMGDRRVLSRWATLGYIMVATIPQTFGGITVALAKHPLYPTYGAGAPRRGHRRDDRPADRRARASPWSARSRCSSPSASSSCACSTSRRRDDGDDGGGGGGRRRGADTPEPAAVGLGAMAGRHQRRPDRAGAGAGPPVRVPAGAGPRRG